MSSVLPDNSSIGKTIEFNEMTSSESFSEFMKQSEAEDKSDTESGLSADICGFPGSYTVVEVVEEGGGDDGASRRRHSDW